MTDAFSRIIDLSNKNTAIDKILQPSGISEGELGRFLAVWGECVSSLPPVQRPQAVLFFLKPTRALVVYDKTKISAMVANICTAQHNSMCCEYEMDGTLVASHPIPQDTLKTLKAGGWTKEQAAQTSSASNNSCVCLAVGPSFYVYVNAVPAIGYSDVQGRVSEDAADLMRRQGWCDGELLERCGQEDLTAKGPIGIWHCVDLNILKHQPESAIQGRLELYLKARLSGYSKLTSEQHVENEGRVDFAITLENGHSYYVEVKWIGKAIKAQYSNQDKKWLEKHKNSSKVLTILDEANAHSGVGQLECYVSKDGIRKGYLAVYDCREVGKSKDGDACKSYPKARKLRENQYKVLHVPVDPRSASVKAKAP